jgi:ubiquinone/menaquinone biosynthesis C-methylase UbiE
LTPARTIEPVTDSETPDAETPDAGNPDAGNPDAGRPGAETPDAETPDAGTPDAGTPDAGNPDAETPDAKVRRVWDKAASTYDRQIGFLERVWFTGAREWLGARARGRVLEVAVGTGRNLPFYAGDVELSGIELSPEMLAIARRRVAAGPMKADLREGDAEHLPYPAGSFDTVVCAISLCTIPHPATAIAEMHRVLTPGGRLLLVDHIGSTWPPVRAAQWLIERVTIRTAGEHFTRRQLPLVEAAGFRVVETERLKAGTIERIHAVKS